MSIKAKYTDGVFKPLEDVRGITPGKIYEVFSEDELRRFAEDLRWLKASEKSFEFWDNDEDAVYDKL
ncbi:MAG TPA: hypothetical protein VE422_01605 [Terriglobia bacterium]|nr:hypothetical protein [Terriglobia bacterium]